MIDFWTWSNPCACTIGFCIACIVLGVVADFLGFFSRPPLRRCYFCKLNGIVGVVCAKDYDAAAASYWEKVRKGSASHPGFGGLPRLKITPTFLFADRAIRTDRNLDPFLVGTIEEFTSALQCIDLEERQFFVPQNIDGVCRSHLARRIGPSPQIGTVNDLYRFCQGREYIALSPAAPEIFTDADVPAKANA